MSIEVVCTDLAEEMRALDKVAATFGDRQWIAATPFFDWTVRDQIMHLAQVERFGLLALSDAEAFKAEVVRVRAAQAAGRPLSVQIRQELENLSNEQVLELWRTTSEGLLARLRAAGPKERMPWFGPDMGVHSFATARIMEVWAHGQDIHDTFGIARSSTGRLRHICDLGVRTFRWSFSNRGLEAPAPPSVRLTGPESETWNWDSEGPGSVRGNALDFSLVVTQRRAVEDTSLITSGEAAAQWLQIAQCFAGAPQERAAPGSRPPLRTR